MATGPAGVAAQRGHRLVVGVLGLALGLVVLLAAGQVPAEDPGLSAQVRLDATGALAVAPHGRLLGAASLRAGDRWPRAETKIRNITGGPVRVTLRSPGVVAPPLGEVEAALVVDGTPVWTGDVEELRRGADAFGLEPGQQSSVVLALAPRPGPSPSGTLDLPLQAVVTTPDGRDAD